MTCTRCGKDVPAGAAACGSCGTATSSAAPRLDKTLHGDVSADLIAGRFKLVEQIGKGGAGVVYRARDAKLDEEVALKILEGSGREGAEAAQEVERFKREIRTARKITHPSVIRIHDFGESGADVFISMELLEGGTLSSRMRSGIALGPAIEIAIGMCDGLAAAHELGIVHRDLKPDNVLFDEANRPKIADFGLARLAQATTKTIGFSGTPYYMSPEHANGGDITFESDIYSLGVVFYHMFTGRLPFLAENFMRLVTMHCTELPAPMRTVAPQLPEALDRIVLKCLAKQPADRYRSVTVLADELRAVRAGLAAEVASLVVTRNPDLGSSASLRSSSRAALLAGAAPAAAPRSNRMLFAGGGIALVVVAGLVLLQVLRQPAGTQSDMVPTATSIATATLEAARTVAPEATPTAAATVAMVAQTPAPTSAPNRTPRPTPVKTTAPLVVAKEGKAKLTITGDSFFEVWLNNESLGSDVPMTVEHAPGTFELRLVKKSAGKFKREFVTLKAGHTTTVRYQTKEDVLTVTP